MMQYGEVLQKGRFYRDNLRTAKAEFTYVSKGKGETIRPHFTYYGFRYVKIKGLNPEKEYKFIAYRIMSDIERTGWVATDHDKVNHLLENTLRSQKWIVRSVMNEWAGQVMREFLHPQHVFIWIAEVSFITI